MSIHLKLSNENNNQVIETYYIYMWIHGILFDVDTQGDENRWTQKTLLLYSLDVILSQK